MTLFLAIGLAASTALAAFLLGSLTRQGALAAFLVGTAVLHGTGVPGTLALLTFFIGSTLVSRWSPDPAAERLGAKGIKRDAWQVLANGGPAALAALLGPGPGVWAVTSSLAVAAADTWATSIGAWSRRPPRHLFTGRPVTPGTSGGITLLGTVGALAGSLSVAAAGAIPGAAFSLLAAAVCIGMLGMLADSAVGAAWQGRFYCDRCGQDTERRIHICGNPAAFRGGLEWLSNDGVNAIATTAGALGGLAGWWWLAS
jgi:uncharacterized protein (TIGR00297 family)